MPPDTPRCSSQSSGALLGSAIGDALAMPVHWYYNRLALAEDYGHVRDFLKPRNPHPDSILWRSHYTALNEKGEILHDQAPFWGQRGVHYHQNLDAGENTVTLQLANLLQESLLDCGGYDADDYLDRYIAFMTTPGQHRDTYLEECHRGFFENYARGNDRRRCGIPEKHIGGLASVIPLGVFFQDDPEEAFRATREHLSLTHPGSAMEQSAKLLLEVLLPVLGGGSLLETIRDLHSRQVSPLLGFSLEKLLTKSDEDVIGPVFSPACYVSESVPGTLFLAAKYHDLPEEGLIANTNLGGDNVHRGAILGALLGAENGASAWPDRWSGQLQQLPTLLSGCSRWDETSAPLESAG
ncbi:MAG: ADP-ribosylglycohydrolase family protein [Verrucomicrobiota bacterium]